MYVYIYIHYDISISQYILNISRVRPSKASAWFCSLATYESADPWNRNFVLLCQQFFFVSQRGPGHWSLDFLGIGSHSLSFSYSCPAPAVFA